MKKSLAAAISAFLLLFYIVIIMYVFFAIMHIDAFSNFECAITFEIIGFLLLIYCVMSNVLGKRIKTGFFVPLIMVTVIYTIILDVINIACAITMPHMFFILINIILLFIYCLISLPMYAMGKR